MPSEKGLTKNHHTLSQTNSESTHKTLSRLEQMQRNMFDFWARHTVQYTVCTLKPEMYRCILSNRDRLALYTEIQIIFETMFKSHRH